MVKQQNVTHRCGCTWTVMYARGASKREAKVARESAAKKACAKCEGKNNDAS